jgi:hypothetical protein
MTSALDEGEGSASRPGRFTPGEVACVTNWHKILIRLSTEIDNMGPAHSTAGRGKKCTQNSDMRTLVEWTTWGLRRRWEDNIEINLKEIRWQVMELMSWDGSIGIATGWTARVQFPTRPRDFYVVHRVQTDSEAHPSSYPVGTGGCSPGGKVTGAWSWPLTSIWYRGQEWWSYTSTPPCVFV